MYKKIIGFLFFLFFTCVGLSPAISGKNLYLYLFIPILDFSFIKSLIRFKFPNESLYLFLSIVCFIAFLSPSIFIRICFLTWVLSYIRYLKKNYISYLNFFVFVNVCIALVQYVSLIIYQTLIIDVASINRTIYGAFYMTMGNQWDWENPLLLFRVSGLSKEPGFFSVFLIISFFVNEFSIKNKKMRPFYLLGILLSLSKVSVVVILGFICTLLVQKIINSFNRFFIFTVLIFSSIISINILYAILPEKVFTESIINRTITYRFLGDMNVKEFFSGVELESLNDDERKNVIIAVNNSPRAEDAFKAGGFLTVYVENGIIIFILLVFLLLVNCKSPYFLYLYTLAISSSNPLTISSFSILGIYFVTLRNKDNNKGVYENRY